MVGDNIQPLDCTICIVSNCTNGSSDFEKNTNTGIRIGFLGLVLPVYLFFLIVALYIKCICICKDKCMVCSCLCRARCESFFWTEYDEF